MSEKIRKIFLEELPRKQGKGVNKNKLVFDWSSSIGYKIKFIYNNTKGYIEIINYDKNNQKLIIIYNQKQYSINSYSFIQCNLGVMLEIKTSNFKIEIGQVIKDNKRDITITNREYRDDSSNKGANRKWYKYKCNICGWAEGWTIEGSLLSSTGCSCCANKTPVLGINTIYDTDSWMIPYIGEECAKTHTHGSADEVYSICPDCYRTRRKKMKIRTIYTEHSIGCSCGDSVSYPNKFMFNILEQLGLDFETEYSPEWIKPKRYDFYISSMNLIIEMDGELGHGKRIHSKNKVTKEESKLIDIHKDKVAEEYGIKVIRINCDKSNLEFIKQNILDSIFAELFDLSKIDWLKTEKFALSNLVKVACEYKRNNPDLATKEISQLMHLSTVTICKYLKKGNEFGWCNYDTKEECKKGNSKAGKSLSKPIIIIEKQLIFVSCLELERQSEELFGFKLDNRNISAVCNGKRKSYKDLHFKKIEDLTKEEYVKYNIKNKLKIYI